MRGDTTPILMLSKLCLLLVEKNEACCYCVPGQRKLQKPEGWLHVGLLPDAGRQSLPLLCHRMV